MARIPDDAEPPGNNRTWTDRSWRHPTRRLDRNRKGGNYAQRLYRGTKAGADRRAKTEVD